MRKAIRVEPLENYRIRVWFEDGLAGEADLSDMIGIGIFEKLADPSEFAKVYIDQATHTVAWPGDIDICPDSLYEEILARQKAA